MTDTTDRTALYASLRYCIELYYDYQQARISYHHRAGDPNETQQLSPEQREFMLKLGKDAETLERGILRHAAKSLQGNEIYTWLVGQRGIADTFAVILLGMIDIQKAETVSKLWRFCGLAAINGKAERPVKGEKLHYSPRMKTRMFLLGESFIKARNTEWRAHYDDYKARKKAQIGTCMLCDGTGSWAPKDGEAEDGSLEVIGYGRKRHEDGTSEELVLVAPKSGAAPAKARKPKKCPRCVGTGQAPWGRSDKHVHMASMRYMVKMFLAELYRRWRGYEGLPIREPYASEYHERLKVGAAPRPLPVSTADVRSIALASEMEPL